MALLVALIAVGALTLNVVDAEMPIDLQIEDLSPGKPCESPTGAGDLIYVHYTGRTHPDLGGHVFESTSNKKPIKFQLGAGRVIRGWDDGLLNMCPGARRRLIIPPSHGYDATSKPDNVEADATLVFSVELVHIERPDTWGKIKGFFWIFCTVSAGATVWYSVWKNTSDIIVQKKK